MVDGRYRLPAADAAGFRKPYLLRNPLLTRSLPLGGTAASLRFEPTSLSCSAKLVQPFRLHYSHIEAGWQEDCLQGEPRPAVADVFASTA